MMMRRKLESDERPEMAGPAPTDELDALWDLIDDDRNEEAAAAAAELAGAWPVDGEVRLALGAAACEAERYDEAVAALEEAARLGVGDEGLLQWYRAETCFRQWRFEEGRRIIEPWLERDPQDAWAWHLLARLREYRDDPEGAEAAYRRAAELAPEEFFPPPRLTTEEMDEAVARARSGLPTEFRAALDELPVQIRPLPDLAMARDDPGDPLPPDLLGLFTGTSRLDRSVFTPLESPGVVFLFQRNLERLCPDRASLIEEIRITLWHELAHYLGFDEEAMPDLGLD